MYRSTINQLLLYSLEDFELQVSVYNKTNSKLIVYLSHFTPKSLAKVNFSLRYMQRVVVPASVVTPGDGASKYVTYFPRNRSARSLSFMSMVSCIRFACDTLNGLTFYVINFTLCKNLPMVYRKYRTQQQYGGLHV